MAQLLCRFETLAEYEGLKQWLDSLKTAKRMSEWGDAVRYLIENDLFYLLTEVLSDGRVMHSDYDNQRFLWHQTYVDMCRNVERQIAVGGGLDQSARGAAKSTVRTKAANIQRMIKYPNSTGCIFSFQRKQSRKHFLSIKEELETNEILRTVCDDVLYWDPRSDAKNGLTTWSKDEGIRVKRTGGVVYKEQSLEYNAFFDGTPVGGRYDWLDFDDIEDDRAVSGEEMREKLHQTYEATLFVLTAREMKPPVVMVTNTVYADNGLVERVKKQIYDEHGEGETFRIRMHAGENLDIPGNGPLGGTPQYPFTLSTLQGWYKKLDTAETYGTQICCSIRAGAGRKFQRDWLHEYPEPPERVGRNCNVYLCIDPSRGVKDPTVIWVWGLGPDRKFRWLDVSVKWLDPALPEFGEEVLRMIARWQQLGKRVVEIRIEQFGQATFAELIDKYLRDNGYSITIVACADNMRTGKFDSGKRDREFERWAFPAKSGEVMIPLSKRNGGQGLIRDMKGKNIDMVDYFIEQEWLKFPKPLTDNMLDAGSLIWEPEEKIGRTLSFAPRTLRQFVTGQRGVTAMSMG